MKEYDCWLQEGFTANLRPLCIARLHAEEGGEALRQAALELREGLAKRFGLCVPDGSGGAASGYCTDNLLFDIVYILLWM